MPSSPAPSCYGRIPDHLRRQTGFLYITVCGQVSGSRSKLTEKTYKHNMQECSPFMLCEPSLIPFLLQCFGDGTENQIDWQMGILDNIDIYLQMTTIFSPQRIIPPSKATLHPVCVRPVMQSLKSSRSPCKPYQAGERGMTVRR